MTSLPIACGGAAGAPTLCPISKGMPCPGFCIFADVMDSVRLGIVLFNLDERTLAFVNRPAQVMFESLGQTISYDSITKLLVPEGVDMRSFESPLAPEPIQFQNRLIGCSLYQSRGYAWAYLRDITDKARLESIAEAVELMNSIGFVFSGVRHELGNPINSVKTALSVLQANLERYSREQIADYLDRMLIEVGRVEHLLRSMKSFSMYERMKPERVPIDVFLRDYHRLIRDEAERRNINLTIDCAPNTVAKCDHRALQQVFLNLFANAADALEEQDDPTVRIDARVVDGLVRILFVDNGPGISDEQRENLFKPFYTSKQKGTGLGLVITRKLLAKMQGTITMDSTVGQGATAVITLPAARR